VKESREPHLGSALALGAAAAALAALPDVRRVAEGVASPGAAWVALTGGTALVLGPLLALVRAARERARGLRVVLLGALLAGPPLAVLGQLLKTSTHHRPLGAATFGVLALIAMSFSLFVSYRLHAWAARGERRWRQISLGLVAVIALAGSALVLLRALASVGAHHDVIDGMRILAAGVLARMALDQPRVEMWARRAGALAWIAIVLGGLVVGRGALAESIREHAPVLGGPLTWL
jgi:hypothetical protein